MVCNTVPRHIWKHEVELACCRAGVDRDWLTARFAARMVIWHNAGETIDGAVQMILFTWKQEPIETRADREVEALRDIARRAAKLPSNWDWARKPAAVEPTTTTRPRLRIVK